MDSISISQNFLRNLELVDRLVRDLGINLEDTVIEIGAGKGIITYSLKKYSKNVIAIELDRNLFEELEARYKENQNVTVLNEDFLRFKLPETNFKTFSNIPFSITSEIIKKLTSSKYFVDGCLVVQRESIFRYGGEQLNAQNTVLSILLSIEFEISIAYDFLKSDFTPAPAFNIVLLRFKRREDTLISQTDYELFSDFISYIFNRSTPNISRAKLFSEKQLSRFNQDIELNPNAKPSQMKLNQFIYLFNFFKTSLNEKVNLVKGEYMKNKQQENRIVKINRTRKDINWLEKRPN